MSAEAVDRDTFRELRRPRWDFARAQADKLSDPYSVPPVPVLEIAERSGVDVILDPFDRFSEVVAGFCDFASRRLYVNSNDPISRQTFTIAHELGHWVLHRDYFLERPESYPVLPRFQKTVTNNPFEQEANCFAANLLVPRRLLLPVRGAPVSELASIFSVSREMMENRLKNV
jgi:Zn-dependent peptidase ImmA (M78 family)